MSQIRFLWTILIQYVLKINIHLDNLEVTHFSASRNAS